MSIFVSDVPRLARPIYILWASGCYLTTVQLLPRNQLGASDQPSYRKKFLQIIRSQLTTTILSVYRTTLLLEIENPLAVGKDTHSGIPHLTQEPLTRLEII